MKIISDPKLDFKDVLIQPIPSSLQSRSEINLLVSYITKYSHKQVYGLPVFIANMLSVGEISMASAVYKDKIFTALHKYIDRQKLVDFFNESFSKYSFMTIGIQEDDLDRLAYVHSHTNLRQINVDVANGYIYKFLDTIKRIRDKYSNLTIMAGTVATPEGAENVIKAGADICRCGIANGGVCITKHITGVGYKQFSVCVECSQAVSELGGLMCSDGGCKEPGDICKALGAGANFVMCGSMFAGFDENEGDWIYKPEVIDNENPKLGESMKIITGKTVREAIRFYGMASKSVNEKYVGELKHYRAAEGREEIIPYKGPVSHIVQSIKGGLASCCTYTNTKNLQDLSRNCVFTR